MTSITTAFADALATVRRPSTFFVAGTEEMLAPKLEVEGVGPIALPLLPAQAEQLIAAAERAPYGLGSDTLIDTQVRRTWQIDPSRAHIGGKHWPNTIKAIVTRVAEGLGLSDPIEAQLYKLLVYDQGSFFVPHRDTEKAAGMFGTLVLALPSVSQGGELIVRHKDNEARLTMACEEPSDVAFAAFYADCVHEVLPVTAGNRLVLVYNLLRHGAGRLPTAPDYAPRQDELTAVLEKWVEALRSPENGEPEKLIYQLEHAYTPAELGFGSLKGADAGIAQVVLAAAQRTACDVHLALVSVEEDEIAQQTGGFTRHRRSRYDYDEDDEADSAEFEVVEVSQRIATASHWRRPDGDPSPLTKIPVEETEFSPALSFDELDPDEEHFHEATGNEGASYERTYSRTALILWPRDRILAVINQAGLEVTLPFLEDLANRCLAAGDASLRDQAAELSDRMAAAWPMHEWCPGRDKDPTAAGQFLRQLVRLEDTSRLEAFLATIAGRHGFDLGDCADIAAALLALPADSAPPLAKRLIEGAAEPALAACANLLERVSAGNPKLVAGAARALVAALPGDPARVSATRTWRRGPSVLPDFIVDLFTALGRVDAPLAAVTADHVLDWPATYAFDTILIPAMHPLLDAPETAALAAVQRLRAACLIHLDARIALSLEAPNDWRRDDKLGCDCKDCRALAAYLADATQKVWVFQAAEPRRSHVETTIRYAHCDVNTATERRGSPHRLICTKSQASYERRRVQRAQDLAERERLNQKRPDSGQAANHSSG